MTLKNFIAMANGEYTLTVIDDTERLCEYKRIGNLQYPGDMIDNWDDGTDAATDAWSEVTSWF